MTFDDALKLYQEKCSDDPLGTWFFVNTADAVSCAAATLSTALVKDTITTLKDFARTVVLRKRPAKVLLNADEQTLIFADIAGRSKFGGRQLPSSLISQIVTVYTFAESDRVTIPECSEKHRILAGIIAEYKTWCRENNALDSVSLMQEAIEILKAGEFGIGFAVFDELRPTTVLAEELLAELMRFPHVSFPVESDINEAMELHQFRAPAELKSLTIYSDERTEMESVLEQIASLLEQGVEPEDILILSPSVASAELLLRETIPDFYYRKDGDVHAIPFVCREKGPLLASLPPVQALLAALEIAGGTCTKENLSLLVSSPYFPRISTRITPGVLSEIAQIAGPAKTPDEWKIAASRAEKTKRRSYQYVSGELERIFSRLAPLAEGATYRTRCIAVSSWLETSGWMDADFGCEYDNARWKLEKVFETIIRSIASDISCSYQEFLRHFQSIIMTKTLDRRNLTGVRLTKLPSGSSLKADYVFLTGMTSDRIPTQTTTVPPFSEQETEELFAKLRLRSLENSYFQFANALKCATKELRISCSRRNGTKNTTPSTFMMMLGEPADVSLPVMHSAQYNQIRAGQALSGEREDIADTVGLTNMASVELRAAAEANNTYSADFGGTELEEEFGKRYSEEEKYAPTTLEEYIECPFQWYLDKHLKLYAPSEEGAEPMKIGSLVHGVLEQFFKEFPESVTKENIPEAKACLLRIAGEEFEKHEIETPSWTATQDWYLGRENLPTPFETFLDDEAKATADGWVTEKEYLEYKLENAKITWNGQSMITNGRIDRVQKRGNEFRIIDYKTGKSFSKKMTRLVQIPLYMEAFKEKTGMEPKWGTYYEISPKNAGEQSPFSVRNTVEKVTTKVMEKCFESRDRMSHGDCKRPKKCQNIYCRFKRICRSVSDEEDQS